MRPGTGLPVVGMVGGGQLARMTHQAAIALGQSLRVLAASPGRRRRAGRRRRRDRRAHRPGRAARLRQGLRRGHLRPRARAARSTSAPLAAEGVPVYPAADALLHAQDKQRDARRGSPSWARRCRAGAGRGRGRRRRLRARRSAGRWSSRRRAAATTAAGVWMVDGRGRTLGRRCWPPGTPLIVEERVPLRRELAVAGGPVAVRAGRGLPGGGDRAARRHLRRGARPGARTCPRSWRSRPSSSPSTSPPSSAWSACSPSSCSRRDRPATCVVNELAMRPHNSGHWTIEGARTSQFEQHLRAVLDYPLGDTALTAPAVVMANVLGGQPARHARSTSGCTTCSPPTRARRCTSTASRSGPAARSGTSRCSATTWPTCGARRGRARPPSWLQEGGAMTALVGVIMGSDSDWPTMPAAAEALAEFEVPYEVRVVSAHRTPRHDARLRRRRPPDRGLQGHHRRRRRRGPPARHGRQRDPAAGDRRAGAAEAPRRHGLAAVDRADAGRRPGGHGRRSAAPATPACSPCASSPPPTRRCGPACVAFQAELAETARGKDAALQDRDWPTDRTQRCEVVRCGQRVSGGRGRATRSPGSGP